MVVLEEGSMLTTGPNQYLQPDYLSPLPTTLDAKKSPLALLAQTCSQIGADSPSKPLMSSLDKASSKGSSTASSARSPPAAKLERSRNSPSDGGSNNKSNSTSSSSLAFKPYETNVVSKQRSSDESSRPASKSSSVHSASGGPDSSSASASDDTNNNNSHKVKSSHRATPVGRKSASPSHSQTSPCNSNTSSRSSKSPNAEQQRKTPGAQEREKSSASPKNSSGASPIIRSGMEILSGHKDAASMYKSGGGLPYGAAAAAALCCPPGMAENPAFRPPFAGASPFSHHHAAALLGYPGANNPYLSYARVKTPSGGETLVPVCKDPFCTGCQYSVHNLMGAQAAAAAAAAQTTCPSGCTQCDHQKYGLMGLSSLGPMPPPSMAGYPSPMPSAAAAAGKPHVCSWIAGDSYCGKRFATSEELLQHLRSHTSLGAEALHPLLSPGRGYPAPSLSPLSARYHPYGKPPTGPLPASLAASPYSAFNALGPYYSPYAIYGQRLGAAVHP